jgi:hypothetical protein
MRRRSHLLNAGVPAMAGPDNSHGEGQGLPGGPSATIPTPEVAQDPTPDAAILRLTHDALFDLWFPIKSLDIPPTLRPEIERTAALVGQNMYIVFARNPAVHRLLLWMTVPESLPFSVALKASRNPAVVAFLAANYGFADLPSEWRGPLFSFLFEGSAGPLSTQIAMTLREAYLSGIWDLPLAVPLCDIEPPRVFVDNPRQWARDHAPKQPPSRLVYDVGSRTVRHRDGMIDYIVVGSGPAGSVVATQLQRAGKRVVLVERGPFVVWGSMDTRSYPALMFGDSTLTTVDNSLLLRSGETLGGGTTVNIDLAFSPLMPNIQKHIAEWAAAGLIDGRFYTPERIAAAYEWVSHSVPNYLVSESELNPDNLVLYRGAERIGAKPSCYTLNRYRRGQSPSPVDDKHDAAAMLLYPSLEDPHNPLSVIPDARVDHILFDGPGPTPRAIGLAFTAEEPWITYGNTLPDPARLQIPTGQTVSVLARNVILCGGTLGTTEILMRTARQTPAAANPRIGKGFVTHPSMAIIGSFSQKINMLKGLGAGVFVDSFLEHDGFILEAMTGLPAYGALLIMTDGKQVFDRLRRFNYYAGYGVALIDTPAESNAIGLDPKGNLVVNYRLSSADAERFRRGVAIAAKMMLLAGAQDVVIPSNENILGLPDFDPMRGVIINRVEQTDLILRNLQFTPNRTFLIGAHLQAANKMGPSAQTAVVSTRQRLWATSGAEIENVYLMDSSIFPTSIGANPMQSIYTFAKIFCDRLLNGAI